MLGHLIRKEILDQLLSLRFIILSAIAALTIWLSLYDGYAYYQARVEDYRHARAFTEVRFPQLIEIPNWGELGFYGFHEHKPPTVMSVFVRGLDPVLGRTISNSFASVRRLRWSPGETEPIQRIFPPLDLGFVVQVLLSLFVLLLTYDAVCGEKEAGTLRLISSFPAQAHRILLGKLFGILIPTLLAFGLPLCLGIAVLIAAPDVSIRAQEWMRLIVIVVVFGIYLSAYSCAGLLASCLTHRPATSFVLLLTFWVATVVVMPRVSLIAADVLRPAPSVSEHHAQRAAIEKEMHIKVVALDKQYQREHPEFHKTPESREARQIQYWRTAEGLRRQKRTEHDRLDAGFRSRYNTRLRLALMFARISPAFTFKNSIVRLAGTGIDRHNRFETTFTQVYMKLYTSWKNTALHLDLFQENYPEKYGYPNRDYSKIPRFSYREIWPVREVQSAMIDVGLLALWGIAFFAGAYVSISRYDKR